MAELDKLNFNLLVYFVKLCELRSRPVVLEDINDNTLRSIGNHCNLVTLHNNTEKSAPVINQTQIIKNIYLMWEIINENLEDIGGTKGVPVLWCVCDTVFPKDHRVDPTLDYIRIGEELVARCPMILANYSGPRDEATADDIHMRGRTAVYCTDSKIILHDISHIFRGSALWVHAKCAVKMRDRRLMYKRI